MLDLIDTAIAEILQDGQTYAIGGRAHSRADLKELRAMRKDFASQLESETHGRVRNLARFDKPS